MKSKLDKLLCIKCDSPILRLADGGGSSCYQCPKCKARYCHGLVWEIYNEKEFKWEKCK